MRIINKIILFEWRGQFYTMQAPGNPILTDQGELLLGDGWHQERSPAHPGNLTQTMDAVIQSDTHHLAICKHLNAFPAFSVVVYVHRTCPRGSNGSGCSHCAHCPNISLAYEVIRKVDLSLEKIVENKDTPVLVTEDYHCSFCGNLIEDDHDITHCPSCHQPLYWS